MLEKVLSADAPELRGMLNRYLAELAAFQVASERASGEYSYFEVYWREPGRYPFFIVENGRHVGFVLIRGPESTGDEFFEVAEFFVEPQSRCSGVGARTVREIWDRFPGAWRLQAYRGNGAAVRFWSTCMKAKGVRDIATMERMDGDQPVVKFSFLV
jgi:predicted acetyltransferase